MRTIESLLSTGETFMVNTISCMDQAHAVRKYSRPKEKFIWSELSLPNQLVFKVAFISICHQFNWDFLQEAIARQCIEHSDLPNFLTKITSTDLQRWLEAYPKKERIKAKERAALLRNVGNILVENYAGNAKIFYSAVSKCRFDDGSYIKLMNQFDAYRSDPLKKKSNVLSHDLIKERIVDFEDSENVEPAIDYHIMRVYLRTGRVVAKDKALLDYIMGAPNPRGSLVKQLREAVSEAEKLTAFYAELNVADLNYIEWQIGRTLCLNEIPKCTSIEAIHSMPEDVKSLCQSKCPYFSGCAAVNHSPEFIALQEPKFVSKNY